MATNPSAARSHHVRRLREDRAVSAYLFKLRELRRELYRRKRLLGLTPDELRQLASTTDEINRVEMRLETVSPHRELLDRLRKLEKEVARTSKKVGL